MNNIQSRRQFFKKVVVAIIFLSCVIVVRVLADTKVNDSISNSTLTKDSTIELSTDTCDVCNGKGYIYVKCPYCGGSGNAVHVSKWRMQHDIDYWVCEHCRGLKKIRKPCPKCKK